MVRRPGFMPSAEYIALRRADEMLAKRGVEIVDTATREMVRRMLDTKARKMAARHGTRSRALRTGDED